MLNTMLRYSNLLLLIWTSLLGVCSAQDSPTCGETCIADVSGTTCSQAQFSCLCLDQAYLERVNTCAQRNCNTSDYDLTIGIVAQICDIFNASPTIGPYATATNLTANPILSTFALPTSVPAIETSISPTSVSLISGDSASLTALSGTRSSSDTTPATMNTVSSSTSAAAATTTNVAQRIDLSRTAVHGAALALLGLAFYL